MHAGEETSSARSEGVTLGLALSGGGFRASFFHLGVLAQLARHGILRHVEALSTVSGGSIIGTLYYIELKNLLESKTDEDIRDEDYVQLVERMEIRFLEKVQLNPRMLTFADLASTLRMFRPDYSRSDRIGEIYDELFYRPVLKPGSDAPIQMRELKIHPLLPDGDLQTDFDPNVHNAQRKAKIPVLLLNATALNNGHNWRFEAVRMGTSPLDTPEEREIDKNFRLLRADRYEDILEKQQRIELGLAVAASACVPGIFHPLAISDLYEQGVRVQLVDGGVHDNQGVQGLLDRQCNVLLVSDASGQMDDEAEPSTRIAQVTGRTNQILMDRVREEQLLQLARRSGAEMTLVHLRKGIESKKIRWIGVDGKPHDPAPGQIPLEESSQAFGVHPEVQELLSLVRTDLDSFSEVEARSLMMDGYLMSGWEVKGKVRLKELARPEGAVLQGEWKFLEMEPWMKSDPPSPQYLKHLRVARHRLFKAFRLNPLVSLPILGGVLAFLGWLLLYSPLAKLAFQLSIRQLALFALIILLGYFAPTLLRLYRPLRALQAPVNSLISLITRALLPATVVPLVKFHLRTIDPWFLKSGKVSRLRRNGSK